MLLKIFGNHTSSEGKPPVGAWKDEPTYQNMSLGKRCWFVRWRLDPNSDEKYSLLKNSDCWEKIQIDCRKLSIMANTNGWRIMYFCNPKRNLWKWNKIQSSIVNKYLRYKTYLIFLAKSNYTRNPCEKTMLQCIPHSDVLLWTPHAESPDKISYWSQPGTIHFSPMGNAYNVDFIDSKWKTFSVDSNRQCN